MYLLTVTSHGKSETTSERLTFVMQPRSLNNAASFLALSSLGEYHAEVDYSRARKIITVYLHSSQNNAIIVIGKI